MASLNSGNAMKNSTVLIPRAGPTRRHFIRIAATGAAGGLLLFPTFRARAAAGRPGRWRIGSCRVDLPQAREAGLDGVEIPVRDNAEKLQISDPEYRRQLKHQMRETGVAVSSLMMGLFNQHPLVSDPRAPGWLEQCIDAARDLGAGVILVAFFGKGDLRDAEKKLKAADVDQVVARIKAVAPRARAAGVTLALENTLSAKQNAEILKRIGSDAVRLYYDVGNSTRNGYDVIPEIRFLGKRIACIHFKDGTHYLGEGEIAFPPIATAIRDIGYEGWIVLETSNPSKNPVADARRNAAYIRQLFGMS
jgi:sugar phosphate isomerase/epimerase